MADSIKFNVKVHGRPNSVTVRKDILCLWCLMHEVPLEDSHGKAQEFLDDQVVVRWERKSKKYARGLSRFIHECMVKSFLDKEDFRVYKLMFLNIGEI